MIGKSLSHYRISEKLGEGGGGEVYQAKDFRLGRLVALKFLSAKQVDNAAAKRFFREARAASALTPPSIITIHDIGESEAGSFIAMELVQGRTLRALAGLSLMDFLTGLTARGEACTIARGRCSERLARSEAYLPILEALESLLHGNGGEAPRAS